LKEKHIAAGLTLGLLLLQHKKKKQRALTASAQNKHSIPKPEACLLAFVSVLDNQESD